MPTIEFLNYEVVDDQDWDFYDEENFEKAAEMGLPEEDYSTFECSHGEYILEAAEEQGYDWPFSCRAGKCTTCEVLIIDGEMDMETQQILRDEEIEEKNVRLTCIGSPATDHVKLIYNAQYSEPLQNQVF